MAMVPRNGRAPLLHGRCRPEAGTPGWSAPTFFPHGGDDLHATACVQSSPNHAAALLAHAPGLVSRETRPGAVRGLDLRSRVQASNLNRRDVGRSSGTPTTRPWQGA